jgi:hypothetical protein
MKYCITIQETRTYSAIVESDLSHTALFREAESEHLSERIRQPFYENLLESMPPSIEVESVGMYTRADFRWPNPSPPTLTTPTAIDAVE